METFPELLESPVGETTVHAADCACHRPGENLTSNRLNWQGATRQQLAFMRRVYDAHVSRSGRRRRFVPDVSRDQLKPIEGRFKARSKAAEACRDLLQAARRDIRSQSVNVQIGLNSAYRSASHQFNIWQRNFPRYYRETRIRRQGMAGGEHGNAAVRFMVRYVGARVGAPGYSLHNNGLAVDFKNIEKGKRYRNSTRRSATKAWRTSWFWQWLQTNASRYRYFQNTSIDEPWHWEYRESSQSADFVTDHLLSAAQSLQAATDIITGDHYHSEVDPATASAGIAAAALGFDILKSTINTFSEGDITLVKPNSQIGVVVNNPPAGLRRATRDKRKTIFKIRETNPISGFEQVNIQLLCMVQYNGAEVKATFTMAPGGARSRTMRDTKITINNPLDLKTRRAPSSLRSRGIPEYPEIRVPVSISIDRPWPMSNRHWSFDLMLSGLYGIGVRRRSGIVVRDNYTVRDN